MEVAIGGNGNPPFQREVREWQRVDPNTGALLTGRLEADRWITGPQNAYGKVVDSQNVSQPNGIQHTQRKQLEVLQARTSSGSLQVVRAQTQTVQTSSSRWSSTSSSGTKTTQSLTGQRFSIPLQMITNGHHHHQHHPSSSPMTNGSHDTHHFNHNSHHQLITEPSLKLSSLMKNSATSSTSSSRSSPRSPTMFGSTVSQRHHLEATYPTGKSAERGGGSSFEAYSAKLRDFDAERSTSETSDTDRLPQLHRGRSVSNDDLASSDHWDRGNEEENGGDETADWRRVSKIRRSFQFPKSSSPTRSSSNRPPDLPENSVSVSRIREELENGKRLSAVMRNDHADLVALDHFLNGNNNSPPSPAALPPETDTKPSKKPSFLTADSLKEIRGKLKKLSNEPLYREDFAAQANGEKMKPYEEQQHDFTIEKPMVLNDSKAVHQPTFQIKSKVETSHNTNSLENRTRHRDTTSSEWYLRRKSYGFERMAPQSNSMSRNETSTDSGLGRSGELNSWSPTDSAPRGTIITFGENPVVQTKASITFMNGGQVQRYKGTYDPNDESVEIKRHSIAVDESKYVRDNVRNAFDSKSSINVNGYYTREIDSTQSTVIDENGRRQKRVEFCKTEVHFAAESGRVNIVETDGKPPPTSNFRRRRRGSGAPISSAYLEAITSGKPVVHFGDDCKTQITQSAVMEESNNVTVITNGAPDVIVPCPRQDEEFPDTDEVSIRGILKNKPVKPKPFLLGENIESSESLWGVRLRPVSSDISSLKPDDVPAGKIAPVANSSVAERVRIVEERKEGTGYSTKINLNLSNSPYSWEAPPDTGLHVADPNRSLTYRVDDRRKSTNFEVLSDSLKSTSLIMKTIRSQSCYDESSFCLKLPEFQGQQNHIPTIHNDHEKPSIKINSSNLNISSRLISDCKSNIDVIKPRSYFLEETKPRLPEHTQGPLRRESLQAHEDLSNPNLNFISSSSFSSNSSSSFQFERASITEQVRVKHVGIEVHKEEPGELLNHQRKPIAAPRIKVIGSSNTVSHQLSQLRRMYDAAEADSDDDSSLKADEEVKLYLGYGNTTPYMEEKTTELSGSWSRVKAKRASVKQQTKTDLKELPKSNVMTIELHSPTASLQRVTKEVPTKTYQEIPTPKPRQSIKAAESTKHVAEVSIVERTNHARQATIEYPPQPKREAPLKIETGGARKLKDHELLYFGVKANQPDDHHRSRPIANNSASSNKVKETKEKLIAVSSTTSVVVKSNETTSDKWKLSSDKPDLLRHSPVTTVNPEKRIEKPAVKERIEKVVAPEILHQGPIYENLKKPSAYNRKRDVEHNQKVLKEMAEEAEQSLQAISSDKSSKSHHHRRSSLRSSKPLETIDEKRSSKRHPNETKSTSAQPHSESQRRRSCCSNRSNSVSSTESLSRLTDSFRSKTQRKDTSNEPVASVRRSSLKSKDSPQRKSHHRSSSRETQRTTASSSEDLQNGVHRGHHSDDDLRRSRRIRPSSSSREREKERMVLKVDENQRITRSTVRTADDRTRSSGRKGSSDSSTTKGINGSIRSTKSDKNDVNKSGTTKSKVSSPRSSTNDSRKMSRTKTTTSGVVPISTSSSSSKRSSRDHARKK